MKTKDIAWYEKKLESIKKRKRKVYLIQDTKARKKIKDDLKREQRSCKRAEKQNFVVFGEFIGENSFAGRHLESDTKDVILFDVNQYKRGLINPYEFIDNFGHLHIPKIVYEGKYTEELINNVKLNRLETCLKEGIVAKGINKKKEKDYTWQVKIKTNTWLKEVKEMFGDKYLLEELNNDKSLIEIF